MLTTYLHDRQVEHPEAREETKPTASLHGSEEDRRKNQPSTDKSVKDKLSQAWQHTGSGALDSKSGQKGNQVDVNKVPSNIGTTMGKERNSS